MHEKGFITIIEKSFLSVFDTVNTLVEVNRNYKKLISDGSKKYAEWVVETFGTIPLFGVNRMAHISSLHVKLSFSEDIDREKYRDIFKVAEDVKSPVIKKIGKCIDEIIDSAFIEKIESNGVKNKVQCDVAILGIAGSGKTTTLKYLMLLAAQGRKFRGYQRFPFFISLRDIRVFDGCIKKEMSLFFEKLGFSYCNELCNKVLKSGLGLILIDGIDELEDNEQRLILSEIQKIKKILPDDTKIRTIICVSGRPYSLYRSLEGFRKYDVLDLTGTDRNRLIDNWYRDVDVDKGKKLKGYFIENSSISEITTNPLLLSIICALYYNEYDIPKREDEIFNSCIEGLMGKWDMFRDISRDTLLKNLSITKRIDLLSNLASRTLFLQRNVVFSEKDKSIIDTCSYINGFYPEVENSSPSDLLETLYNDFGIIIERSKNIYSFSHLKFQEYLASKWLLEQRKEMQFINKLNGNIMVWGYVVEFLSKNLKSPKIFLIALSSKINFSDMIELEFISSILLDKEVLLSESDRKVIILSIAHNLDLLVEMVDAKYYVNFNDKIRFDFKLDAGLYENKNIILCIKKLLFLISNSFDIIPDILSKKSPHVLKKNHTVPNGIQANQIGNDINHFFVGVNE